MAVSYSRKTWKDGQSGNTPVTATELNRMEKGIADAASQANTNETAIKNVRDSLSQSQYAVGGNGGVKMTPPRDCAILVIAARSNTWGFAGEDLQLSIDCSALSSPSKHIGKISAGDTVGRELVSWAVFTGAKKGVEYTFSESYVGRPQGDGNRTMIAICL